MRKVNLGCGPYKVNGFVNIDRNPVFAPEIVRDITRGLPFDSNSVEELRAHHFLEHLDPDDFIWVIGEIFRVLVPSGRFDLIVPIGEWGCIDHKMVFLDHSFDTLFMAEYTTETSAYYQVPFKWKLLSKTIENNSNPRHKNLTCLHILSEAMK